MPSFTINSDILSATMDIISLVAFAEDIDSVTKANSKVGDDILRIFRAAMARSLSPIPYWNVPVIGQYIDGAGWARNRIVRSFTKLVNEYESMLLANGDNNTKEAKSNTFLGKVFALSKKDNSKLSPERLVSNIVNMFGAGSETTFVTTCSCLYEIAIDRTGLQDELATEIMAFQNFDEAGLEESTEGLPRMRSLVYEVLRIKGPTPFLGLENAEPFEIDGTVQPPSTFFIVLMQYISTLESSEAGKRKPAGPRDAPLKDVCPRRWLEGGKGEKSDGNIDAPMVVSPTYKTGFRPFGTGVRVCPGRDLAEAEVLVILALILSKFEISLEQGHPPMKLVSRFTESPDIDIRLVLKPRKVAK